MYLNYPFGDKVGIERSTNLVTSDMDPQSNLSYNDSISRVM